MRQAQTTIDQRIASDTRPIQEWLSGMECLPNALYEHDPELSRLAERLVRNVASTTANLDCLRTDDPLAPEVRASACDVLAYIFRRWPEEHAEFRRVVARADQLLGRKRLISLVGG